MVLRDTPPRALPGDSPGTPPVTPASGVVNVASAPITACHAADMGLHNALSLLLPNLYIQRGPQLTARLAAAEEAAPVRVD